MWLAKWLQSCLTLCNPMDSLQPTPTPRPGLLCPWKTPGKSTGVGCHYLLQGGSSWPRAWTHVSYVSWIGRWVFFTTSATWEAPDHPLCLHIAFWNSIKDSNPPFRANPTLGVWTFSSLEKGVKALFFSLANISVNCFTTKVSSPNTDNNTFLNILLRVSLVFQTR